MSCPPSLGDLSVATTWGDLEMYAFRSTMDDFRRREGGSKLAAIFEVTGYAKEGPRDSDLESYVSKIPESLRHPGSVPVYSFLLGRSHETVETVEEKCRLSPDYATGLHALGDQFGEFLRPYWHLAIRDAPKFTDRAQAFARQKIREVLEQSNQETESANVDAAKAERMKALRVALKQHLPEDLTFDQRAVLDYAVERVACEREGVRMVLTPEETSQFAAIITWMPRSAHA